MKDNKLTPEILERRRYHIRNAIASFELEGEYASPECLDLLEKFGNGEIETMEELRKMIDLL
ncbi:TPA: antitoxin VbhA family protein [Pasteurella multocida]